MFEGTLIMFVICILCNLNEKKYIYLCVGWIMQNAFSEPSCNRIADKEPLAVKIYVCSYIFLF